MAALLNIALLFILGVAQVSSQKENTAAIVIIGQEQKCLQRNGEMAASISGISTMLQDLPSVQLQVIKLAITARDAIQKCFCGKEAGDKCQEKVDKSLQELLDIIKTFYTDFTERILITLDNTKLLAAACLSELGCCCPNANMCVEKYHYAVRKTTEHKQCKTEKCHEPYAKLLYILDDYITTKQAVRETNERLINYMKELAKAEEELLKGEKCKDEKIVSKTGQLLRRVYSELANLRLATTVLIWKHEQKMFTYVEEGLKERASCGKGK